MTITTSTPRSNGHQIGQDFILAGAAIFTLIGATSRFTYRVSRKDEPGRAPVYFVGLLTGANNDTDYTYLGLLDPVTGYTRLTRKSRMGADAPAVKAIQWALPRIWAKATMPPSFGIMHAGKCGRCGRTLTVPESIATGIGPDCAGKMGLAVGPAQAARPSLTDLVDRMASAMVAGGAAGSSLFEGPAFQ